MCKLKYDKFLYRVPFFRDTLTSCRCLEQQMKRPKSLTDIDKTV